ncbi:MAG: serine/threonine-protein kinase [Schlesneria sp.]
MPGKAEDDTQRHEYSDSSGKLTSPDAPVDRTQSFKEKPLVDGEAQSPQIAFDQKLRYLPLDGASQFPLSPPETPGSIGRFQTYDVMEVIGRGGMGVVFRAFDRQLHRNVAIKAMSEKLLKSETARKRFLREARSAAAINHANVVSIYAAGEEAGYPFLAMEYVNGKTLEDRIHAESPLDVTDALRISSQIASGLAAAHRQGVIHRDIKPSNILIVDQIDRIKISDFGLALLALEQTDLTSFGDVVGTPSFMAPEQINGEDISPATDLFSLGVVIYTMFLGHSPFRAKGNLAALHRINDYHPPMLHQPFPQVPSKLSSLVAQLMEKNHKKRPQSAEAVADELLKIASEGINPVNGKTNEVVKTGQRSWSSLPRLAGLGLATAAGLAGLSLYLSKIIDPSKSKLLSEVLIEVPTTGEANSNSILTDQIINVGGPDAEVVTIEEALNLATPGTVIRLNPGRYLESIKISRPNLRNLRIVGVGEVILEASSGPVLEVHDVSGVELNNLKIRVLPQQIGADIQGSGIGLKIENCHFESANPKTAVLPLLHWHHGREAEPSKPSSIRHCTFKAGGVGVVLGDPHVSTTPPLRDIEIAECVLSTADRSYGIPFVLQSAVERVTFASNTVAHGIGALSFVLDIPGSTKTIRIVNNSFHDFENVCFFNTSDPRQEVEIESNVFIDVSSLHAVSLPVIDYQAWFKENGFVASQTVTDPLPVFFSTRLSRDDFISFDPENDEYLHPRAPASKSFPGRFR